MCALAMVLSLTLMLLVEKSFESVELFSFFSLASWVFNFPV